MLVAMTWFTPAKQSSVSLSLNPVASGPWLDRFNQWRISTGVGRVTENSTFSSGDALHAQYMVLNDLVTHYETPGTPYYTAAGDTAAKNSNIYVSSSTATTDTQAIDWWMQAPFHAMGMMDPRLSTTGFGSYRYVKSGWQMAAAVNVVQGNSFTGGTYPVYFPGNGTSEPLTSYVGGEFPDPLQGCSGYTVPTGLPVFIQVGGNVSTTAGAVHSFTGNGVSLAHCVIDSTNAALGSYLKTRGGVIVIPRQPLQAGVRYTVDLTVNGAPYTWSFTVGAFSTCTSPTASLSPLPGAFKNGSVIDFTAASTGCSNPQYEFWVRAPAGLWTIAQPYGASPAFAWDTASHLAGAYQVAVWVENSGDPTSTYEAGAGGTYTLVGCATASLAPVPGSYPVGGAVSFTASSAGCASPLYEFWVKAPGGYWTIKQLYSASAQFSWSTAGLVPGAYQVAVWATDQGSSLSTYQSGAGGTYALSGCASVTLSPAPGGYPKNANIAFSAAAAGCSSPLYEFWVRSPSGYWVVARAWSTAPTFTWATAGLTTGGWQVAVWAKAAGSGSATYDAGAGGTYTLS